MLKAIITYQSLKKNYQTLQGVESLKKNYLLHTAVIVFLSLFMLHTNEYAYTLEIKAKASDVPAVLSPTATDCKVQWERAVSWLIQEQSFLTPDLAARPGKWEATFTLLTTPLSVQAVHAPRHVLPCRRHLFLCKQFLLAVTCYLVDDTSFRARSSCSPSRVTLLTTPLSVQAVSAPCHVLPC